MSFPSIETRVVILDRESARHEVSLREHEHRIDRGESRIDVMAAKIGIYAALGACLGGSFVSAVLLAFFH